VQDTGAGIDELALASARKHGVGLANVEQRLKGHYGDAASLVVKSEPGLGTTAEINLPVSALTETPGPSELSAAAKARRI
jgi:sensor histidine kinase YesM